jgi:myo-inositol-1(or 4)-monophosphatase
VSSTEDDLTLLADAALAGGELARTFFRRNPNTWTKAGGSPVSEADMAVDEMLRARLLAARPNYGWLSEETADDPARCQNEVIFVVDPIDGTRGFLQGDDRWCVSLAVVRHGRPETAALYAPARDELYTARAGKGARLRSDALAVSRHSAFEDGKIAGPRGWLKSAILRGSGAEAQSHVPSLAYRFASVAAGAFDLAFSSPGAHDWDLAASDLLVHEAGGRLTDLHGKLPCYNRESPRHGVLVAANPTLQPKLRALLADVARERAKAGLPV